MILWFMIIPGTIHLGCKAGTGMTAPVDGVTNPEWVKGSGDDIETEVAPDDIETEVNPCDEAVTEVIQVSFGNTSGCAWGSYGNLEREDMKLQARKEQQKIVGFEQQLCDVRLGFEHDIGVYDNDEWYYSDQVMLLLEQQVVFSSSWRLVEQFSRNDEIYLYNWEDIVGGTLFFDNDHPWAIGENPSFQLPGDEEYGQTYIELESSAVDPLIANAILDNELIFTIVSFGDNDEEDCMHSGFSFSIEADLIP